MKRARRGRGEPANATALVIYTRLVVEKMTNNAWFPQPFPPLAKVLGAVYLLTWALMPRLTRLFRHWLYPGVRKSE